MELLVKQKDEWLTWKQDLLSLSLSALPDVLSVKVGSVLDCAVGIYCLQVWPKGVHHSALLYSCPYMEDTVTCFAAPSYPYGKIGKKENGRGVGGERNLHNHERGRENFSAKTHQTEIPDWPKLQFFFFCICGSWQPLSCSIQGPEDIKRSLPWSDFSGFCLTGRLDEALQAEG